jgi:hypothetical protein
MLDVEEQAVKYEAATNVYFYDTAQGEAVSFLMSAYTESVGLAIDDQADWLNWYWMENGLGKKAMPAARDHKRPLKKIKGLDDLLWLLFLEGKE